MKGFPNQVSNLPKLTQALAIARDLIRDGRNPRSDEVYGEALVRGGVLGTGHVPVPIEEYLRAQKQRSPSNRSFQTSARGLREFFRILGLMEDDGHNVYLTGTGEAIAALSPDSPEYLDHWRRVVRRMTHQGGDDTASHPYQVLLRLIAQRPGISRAKCALALEARDDSKEELERIVALADLEEEAIREEIGATETNWDNAKKILPSLAEQLGDVVKEGQAMYLTKSPGAGTRQPPEKPAKAPAGRKKPITSREVTPSTIAQAGTVESHDEEDEPPSGELDPEAVAAAIEKRLDRLKRHNLLVQGIAERLAQGDTRLFEDPFDCLAIGEDVGLLVEVKTLDGSVADERARVRDALSQLLYYEAFAVKEFAGDRPLRKIAVFEASITPEHVEWLHSADIEVLWYEGEQLVQAGSAADLAGYLGAVNSSS